MWNERKVRIFINNSEFLTMFNECTLKLHDKMTVFGDKYIVTSIQNDLDEVIVQIMFEDLYTE